jgi:hypothetical protein
LTQWAYFIKEIPASFVTSRALLDWSTTIRTFETVDDCVFAFIVRERDNCWQSVMDFEEFIILITEIERCLNSRRFIALSIDLNDPSYLSLRQFLIGAPLTSLPELKFTNRTMNSLSR